MNIGWFYWDFEYGNCWFRRRYGLYLLYFEPIQNPHSTQPCMLEPAAEAIITVLSLGLFSPLADYLNTQLDFTSYKHVKFSDTHSSHTVVEV